MSESAGATPRTTAPPTSAPRTTVGRGAAWTLVYLAALRLATFGQSVAVARVLGQEGAGVFGIALNLAALGAFLAGANLPPILARAIAREDEPSARRELVRHSGGWIAGMGLVAALVLLFGAGPIATLGYRDASLVHAIQWSGPLALSTVLVVWSEHVFHGIRRFDRLAKWGLAFCALDLTLGLWAVPAGVPALQAARTVVRFAAIPLAIWMWRDALRAPAGPTTHASPIGPLLRYAAPAFLSSVVFNLGWTALRLLLVRKAGLSETGLFQGADTLGQGLQLVPAAASIAYLPAASRALIDGPEDHGRGLARALERVSGFHLPLCLGLAALAGPALQIVFGGEFKDAHDAVVGLAVAYGLMGLCTMLHAVATARGDLWPTVVVHAGWAVAALAAFTMLPGRGASAAAFALVAAYAVLLTGFTIVAATRWRQRPAAFLPAIGGGAALLAVTAIVLLVPGPGSPLVRSAIALVLALAVFLRWGAPAIREQRAVLRGGGGGGER